MFCFYQKRAENLWKMQMETQQVTEFKNLESQC